MDFDPDGPLTRIPQERIKAHNALMDYFLMGGGRSLAKLHRKYAETTLNEPPTVHLETLKIWSTKHHWQARVAQQNANDNAITLEQYRQQFIDRFMSKEEVIARLSDQARGDIGEFATVRSHADLEDHPQSNLIKATTQNYHSTQKGEGDEKQVEIKGRITLAMYDAQKALELLAKYHGVFEADNKHQNLNIDVDVSSLTDDQLKRIAAGESIASVLATTEK